MINIIKNLSAFQKASILFTVLILCLFKFLTPVFLVSDDVMINSIAAGVFGSPNEHLAFTHFLLGTILKFLYSNFPTTPWYAIILQSSIYVSWIIFLYTLKEYFSGKWYWFFSTTLFFGLGVFLFLRVHFTFAAGFTTLLSLFFFLTFYRKYSGIKFYLLCFICLFLGFVGSLIRPEAAILSAILFAPQFIIEFIKDFKEKKTVKIFIFLTSLFIIFGVLRQLNFSLSQKDERWRKYNEYFVKRAVFTDYGQLYSVRAAKAAGWTMNDYLLMKNWFFFNENVHSLENISKYLDEYQLEKNEKEKGINSNTLSTINEEKVVPEVIQNKFGSSQDSLVPDSSKTASAKSKPVEKQVGLGRYGESSTLDQQFFYLDYLIKLIQNFYVQIILSLFFLIFLKRKGLLKMGLVYLFGFLLMISISLILKIPPFRVVFMTFLYFIFSSVFIISKYGNLEKLSLKVPFVIVNIFMLCGAALVINNYKEHSDSVLKRRAFYFEKLNKILKDNPDKVFVAVRNKFANNLFFLPIDGNAPAFVKSLKIMPVGSLNSSPLLEDYSKELGISNMETVFIDNRNVMLYTHKSFLGLYKTFALEHYGVNLNFELVDKSVGLYSITRED